MCVRILNIQISQKIILNVNDRNYLSRVALMILEKEKLYKAKNKQLKIHKKKLYEFNLQLKRHLFKQQYIKTISKLKNK